jgi:hypothetical protein
MDRDWSSDVCSSDLGDHTIRKSLELTPSTANKVLGVDVTEWIYNNYQWFYEIFNYQKNI